MNQNRRSSDSDTVIKVAEATINIEHLKRSNDEVRGDMREVKGEIRTLREEMIEMKAEFHIAMDQLETRMNSALDDSTKKIIGRLDTSDKRVAANYNQYVGATRAVRIIKELFPYLSGILGGGILVRWWLYGTIGH